MPDDRYQAQLPIERFFRPRAPRRFFPPFSPPGRPDTPPFGPPLGAPGQQGPPQGHLPHLFPLKEMEVYPSLRLILAQYDHACSGSYIYGLKMADNSGHGLCS